MFDKNKVFLGIAPIAWTNDDMPDLGGENTFEQCLSEAALAGFEGTEVGNKYPKDPEVLNEYLKVRNLRIASAWFSSFVLTKPIEEVSADFIKHRDFLHAVGAKVVVVSEQSHSIQGQICTPVFKEKYVLNDSEWETLARGLEKLGELANEKGMKLVFHHHMGTVVQTSAEVKKLMAITDPEKVFLLFDTGHLAYSKEDPNEILTEFFPRIKHVHLKDIRTDVIKKVFDEDLSFLQGVRLGTFTVPGDGDIDFKPILKYLAENAYEGWLLVEAEQDPASANPFVYALKARNYIRENALI